MLNGVPDLMMQVLALELARNAKRHLIFTLPI